MSDSVQPHRQQPTRLLCPWDSPGKNTGVSCHFLLQCMKVNSSFTHSLTLLLQLVPKSTDYLPVDQRKVIVCFFAANQNEFYIYIFFYCFVFLSMQQRPLCDPQSLTYIPSGPLEKFADICFRAEVKSRVSSTY